MTHLYLSKKGSLKFTLAIVCSLLVNSIFAQNLVINPSFEDVNIPSLQCSWYTSQAQFNTAINNWTCPTGGSTDIFNTALATTCYCSPFSTNASSPGTQAPLTGNGYVNIVTYGNGGCDPWREYVQGELSSAMVVGQTYEVEMWVTLADKMAVGTDNIGVKFSTNPYTQASNCGYYTTPDLNYTGPPILDKDNWVQIIFCYTPTVAGLDNFIIGNFYNDAGTNTAAASGVTTGNTIRYFVEDVRIELASGSGNAGLDGVLNACSSDPTSDLFNSLGGTPDMTGSWTGPSVLGGGYLGTFDPAVNPPGVYTYTVSGAGFCGGGSPSSATVTVAVSTPVATIPAAGPFCSGTPFVLDETGGSGVSWLWSTTGGATITTNIDQSPTITGAIDGETFTVVATDATGCTASDQISVVISNCCVAMETVDFEGFEGGGTINELQLGATVHTTPQSFSVLSGSASCYMNFLNGFQGLVFDKTYNVCVGQTYQFSAWFNNTWGGAPDVDLHLTVYDGLGGIIYQVLSLPVGGAWVEFNTGQFVASTNTIQFQLINNIPGGVGNNDCSMDDLMLERCSVPITNSVAGPICANEPSIDLFTSTPGYGNGGVWSGPSPLTGGYLGTFDPATSVSGTYTYTVPGIGACPDSITTVDIQVNPLPVVNASNTGPVCIDAVSFNVNETGGEAMSWSWSSNVSAVITNAIDQNPTITNAVDGEVFTVTGTDANGCVNTAQTTIVLNPLPVVLPSNSGPICAGDPITLDETGGDGVSWLWTTNGGSAIGNNSTQSSTATGVVDGEIFTVVVTDANGCINSSTTTASVIPIPILDPILDTTVCDSYGLPAVISGTDLTGNQNYYDDSQLNGGSLMSGPITSTQTVYVYDGNGTCSDEISYLVTINPLPTVSNVGGGNTYCPGDAISDVFVDVTGTGAWVVDYTLDGIPMTAGGNSSPVVLGNTPGVYVVTGIADAYCTNVASGTQSIVISPSPAAPQAGVDTIYCSSENYQDMIASGSGGTYTWYSDPALTNVIGTGNTLVPLNQLGASVYYVNETLNGCPGPASMVFITINACDIVVPTAITPNGDGNNDTWEIVDLDYVYPDNVVRVYNRWGNLLFEHDSSSEGPYDQNRWDGTFNGASLPVGSYFYIIEFNDKDSGSASGAISVLKN